jgi:hypothetical protein
VGDSTVTHDGTVPQQDGGSTTSFDKAGCQKALDLFVGAGCADAGNWTKLKDSACNKLTTGQSTSLHFTVCDTTSKGGRCSSQL